MKKGIFIVISLVSFSLSAQNCASIDDSLERLRCYDSLNSDIEVTGDNADNNWTASAKNELVRNFKDPATVRFRSSKVFYDEITDTKTLCGELNAKNSYGAYTGFKRFFYNKHSRMVLNDDNVDRFTKYWHQVCDNRSKDNFPEFNLNPDPIIQNARSNINSINEIGYLNIFRNEKTYKKPNGKQTVCGEVLFSDRHESNDFTEFVIANGQYIFKHRGNPNYFNLIKELECADNVNTEHINSWSYYKERKLAMNHSSMSSLILECKNNVPFLIGSWPYKISPEGGFKALRKGVTGVIKINGRWMRWQLPESGKNYITEKNLHGKEMRQLTEISYRNSLTAQIGNHPIIRFDITGLKDVVDRLKPQCTGANWERNWDHYWAKRDK